MPAVTYTFRGVGAAAVEAQVEGIDKKAAKADANAERRAKKLRRNRARNRLKRIRETKRAAATEARTQQAAERKHMRSLEKQTMARWNAKRKELAKLQQLEEKHAAASARAQAKARRRSGERMGRFAAGAGRVALGAVGAVGTAAAGIGLAGIRQSMSLQDQARQIAVQGRGTGQMMDPEALRKAFEATATRVAGTQASDVASGVGAFVSKTGRLDLATEFQDVFAEVASATSSDLTDVATAAADLMEKFDIKTIGQMESALAALTFQGKAGAFELKDAAGQFARLSAAAQTLGIGKGEEQVRVLGGITQIARRATGGPEEAATAVESMFSAMTLKSKELRKEGVRVFDDKGNARDIRDVLTETIAQTGGEDVEEKKAKLGRIFGKRGIRALAPLIDKFANTSGSLEEKTAAVRDALDSAIDAPGEYSDVLQDAAVIQESASKRATRAWEVIASAMGDEAMPAVAELATTIADFVSQTDAAESLGTVFVALAEAGQLAIEGLQALGLVEKKAEKPGDVMKRVERQRSRVRSRREGIEDRREVLLEKARKGPLTDRETTKLQKLNDQIVKLSQEESKLTDQFKAAEDKAFRPAAELNRDFTQKQFVDQFIEAGGEGGGVRSRAVSALTGGVVDTQRVERTRAEQIVSTLQADPQAQFVGATEQQQQLIQQLRESLVAQSMGQEAKGEDVVKPDLEALAVSAAKATKALNEVQATKRADIGG